MMECGLGRVEDPFAGSYCMEAMTDTIEQEAWEELKKIEPIPKRFRFSKTKAGAVSMRMTFSYFEDKDRHKARRSGKMGHFKTRKKFEIGNFSVITY